ncbi:hypothetical protein PTKIN_Ptkin13bG0022100 [Pterospermum kingtungense]
MRVLIWNVRGFNCPLKQKEVVNRINTSNVDIVCLLETRIKQHKVQRVVDKQFSGWKLFHNYSEAPNGRIWFLLKSYVKAILFSVSDQSITCCIDDNGRQLYVTTVYGKNTGVERNLMWNHLNQIGSKIAVPWFLAGDYNVVASVEESSNPRQEFTRDMADFIRCIEDLGLHDHAYTGPQLTWTNRQDEGFVAKKLDRVLVNGAWNTQYPHSFVEFLPPGISDHSSIIVQLHQVICSPLRPFRFFNF